MTIPPNCSVSPGDIDPEKLEEAIVEAEACMAAGLVGQRLQRLIDAARAHLATLPRFKEVETWHCTWSAKNDAGRWIFHVDGDHRSKYSADVHACSLRSDPRNACIAVTGPHKQRVPA